MDFNTKKDYLTIEKRTIVNITAYLSNTSLLRFYDSFYLLFTEFVNKKLRFCVIMT